MFERFSAWGRQVAINAQEEARELRHATIGPEHLLLGVLREDDELGAVVLARMGLTYDGARATIVPGDHAVAGLLPFTPRAKRVLEQAMREALALGHDGIGAEHVVLALAREDAVPGLDPGRVRDEVLRAIESGSHGRRARPSAAPREPGRISGAAPAEAMSRLGSPWDGAVQANLLLGILAGGGPVADFLRDRGVDADAVRALFDRAS